MQIWGAHSGNQPQLSLAESRHNAHCLLQRCHDQLNVHKNEIKKLFNEFNLFDQSKTNSIHEIMKTQTATDDFSRMKIEDQPNCELRLLMSISHI